MSPTTLMPDSPIAAAELLVRLLGYDESNIQELADGRRPVTFLPNDIVVAVREVDKTHDMQLEIVLNYLNGQRSRQDGEYIDAFRVVDADLNKNKSQNYLLINDLRQACRDRFLQARVPHEENAKLGGGRLILNM